MGMHSGSSSLPRPLLPTFCLFRQLCTVYCRAMVAMSFPSSCPPCYFCPIPLYSVKGGLFQQVLAKITLRDHFQKGALLCDNTLFLPLTTQLWRTYILHGAFFNSWNWGNSVLVESVEAVINNCYDIMLSSACCTVFRSLCLVNLSAPKGLRNTGISMVSV